MKISESVDLIDGTMGNCYSINLPDKTILVDAGTKGSGKKCIEYYRQMGKEPSIVLITHYHPDHIGGLKAVLEAFHPETYVPDKEVDVIEGRARPAPGKSIIGRLVGSAFKSQPVSGVKKASDLKLNEIEVLKTPGHTPGSTSYFLKGEGILFVGDAVVTNSGKPSINRAFTSDYETAQKSMKEIMNYPGKMILSGHGRPYEKGKEEKVESASQAS